MPQDPTNESMVNRPRQSSEPGPWDVQGLEALDLGRDWDLLLEADEAPAAIAEDPAAEILEELDDEMLPPPDLTAAPEHGLRAGELQRGFRRHLESVIVPRGTVKIVYWGPGRSGKTTNVKWLHSRLRPELRGQSIDLDTPGERTLYFDSLPLELPSTGGDPIRLRIFTVPGQPRHRITRQLVLQDVDGIVFVWDSRSRRLNANLASLIELRESLAEAGVSFSRIPRVIQYNKQDLSERIPPEELDHVLDRMGERVPRISSVAIHGTGVLEALGAVTRSAVRHHLELAGPAGEYAPNEI